MGDQHRSDNEREEHAGRERPGGKQRTAQRDADDAQFDPAHAGTQHAYHAKSASVTSRTAPAKTVTAVGDDHYARLDAAIAAKQPADVLAVARDMDTQQRRGLATKLDELAAFMTPRDLLTVGELSEAKVSLTLLAVLQAQPPITRAQIRTFMGDVGYSQLDTAFGNPALVTALRAKFPGSPIEVLPQLGVDGALHNRALLTWLFETTPAKTVARLMLDMDPEWVPFQADSLDSLGEAGWKWLEAVDTQMASVTKPATLHAYKHHATAHAQRVTPDAPVVDDAKHVEQLGRLEKTATADAKRTTETIRAEASALRARRADVIAKSSPLQIQQQTQHAGLDATEQLAWILDKPGLTAAQLREVTAVIAIDEIVFSPTMLATIQRRFPKTNPEELFSGGFPEDLIRLGSFEPKAAKWLLQGAGPETTLRIVAGVPDLIDEWCATLVATGIGFRWVQQLGGSQNDYLLRRFALKCPDAPTRQFIEERLLGTDANPGKTKTAPIAAPTAYTSARAHLDADLDQASKIKPPAKTDANGQVALEGRSATIAADLSELKPAEREALRHDATRLKQILAVATQTTFPQILDLLQPELQVAAIAITPDNITAAAFVVWAQTRPAREVVTALSNPTYIERMQAVVTKLGPFEIFPPLATADTLSQILRKNPSVIEWMMASEPSQVLRAFAAPSVIDVAVHALGTLEDIAAIDRWPSAEALGTSGRSVLVQLSARAKGRLKEALDERLKAKLPAPGDDSQPMEPADENALALRGASDLPRTLDDLIHRHAPPSTILAFCRSHPTLPSSIADTELRNDLAKEIELPPDVVFGVPLPSLLMHAGYHSWILNTTPAYRVLNSVSATLEGVFAATVDKEDPSTRKFLEELPRGRALSAANKSLLHRLARHMTRDRRVETMFEITFDTPVSELSRDELEKLWSTLELLPHAHVDQKSISRFLGTPQSPDDTTAGLYRPETQAIELQRGKLSSKEASQYDHPVYMTEAEAIETVGTKADLTRMIEQKVMVQNDDGTYSFVTKEKLDLFPHTILHEVGHAVDYMLGAQTQLVYDLAGWKKFQHGDFDGWASELGGWDSVTEPDKKEIRKAWTSWLAGGAKGTLSQMVDSDHPAIATRYAKVGVVELARQEILYSFTPTNGRLAMAHHSTQSWLTISQKGYNAAPSAYALTAPEEYFAECYANYYREFTAAPNSKATKGATLVPWIKSWFDSNVDKIGHNPLRSGRR